MAETGTKKQRRVVALNGDKLGLVTGSVFATAVLALCFFYRQTDTSTAAIRAGWAFVVAYGAAFFLVRVVLRTTLYEFAQRERERRATKKRARDAAKTRDTTQTAAGPSVVQLAE